MARKSQRQTLLESGEARGILKPEHAAELQAIRARSSGGEGGKAKTTAQDLKQLGEAQGRSEAAGKSVRLYDNIAPVMERFKPGPFKGKAMQLIMPNEDGGAMDAIGSFIGAPARALLSTQTKQDYETLDRARAERVALRQMEQKGVQTDKDAARYAKADISPNVSLGANRKVISENKLESNLVQLRADIESRWVAKYGSKARAAPSGRTFSQAIAIGEKSFLDAKRKRRSAPPSTRRASSGWSAEEIK